MSLLVVKYEQSVASYYPSEIMICDAPIYDLEDTIY